MEATINLTDLFFPLERDFNGEFMFSINSLESKIESLSSYPILKKDFIQKFKNALIHSDDWDLVHMNPYRFAEKNNLPVKETIDIFIHASKVGILDMNYNMICPRCGGITSSHDTLDKVEADEFFCSVCYVNNKSNLDDMVEVAFAIQKGIKILDVNPTDSMQNYFRYYFSANHEKSSSSFYKEFSYFRSRSRSVDYH